MNNCRVLICEKILLYILTAGLLVWKLITAEWDLAALCLLSLALYSLPGLLGKLFKASLPPLLVGIAVFFAAAANTTGRVLTYIPTVF